MNERDAATLNNHIARIEALEKQVNRLSKLVDPSYLYGGDNYQE
jgi:hypothetical protein